MSFLLLNSIPFPASLGSFAEQNREIGNTGPAYSGALRKSRLAVKRDCTFESTLLQKADAAAWDGMIRGLPDVWSFESNLYSSKGTAPVAGYSAVVGVTTTHLGNGRAEISTYLNYPVSFPTAWTLSVWRISQDGASYDHYVIYSNGAVYKNNVASVPVGWMTIIANVLSFACPGYFTVPWAANTAKVIGNIVRPTVSNDRYYIATTNGTTHLTTEPVWPTTINATIVDNGVTWRCEGLYKLYLDEVVFFPFEIPTGWVPYLYGSSLAFGNSPKLVLTGDALLAGTTRSVLGDVPSAKLSRGAMGGSIQKNLRSIQVVLSEV